MLKQYESCLVWVSLWLKWSDSVSVGMWLASNCMAISYTQPIYELLPQVWVIIWKWRHFSCLSPIIVTHDHCILCNKARTPDNLAYTVMPAAVHNIRGRAYAYICANGNFNTGTLRVTVSLLHDWETWCRITTSWVQDAQQHQTLTETAVGQPAARTGLVNRKEYKIHSQNRNRIGEKDKVTWEGEEEVGAFFARRELI